METEQLLTRLLKKDKKMNFKPTNNKVIVSIIIGFLIALINFARQVYQGINASPINYTNVILVWPISSIIVYILWSLFEKKGRK